MYRFINKDLNSAIALQVSFWSLQCTTYVYLSSFLYQNGFSVSLVAFTFAVSKLVGLFVQILLINFLKPDQDEKVLIRIGTILMTVILTIIYSTSNQVIVLVSIILLGIFENSMPALMDAWLINVFKDITTFASIRSFASLSFSMSSLLLGLIIGQIGFKIIPFIAIVLVIITTLLLSDIRQSKKELSSQIIEKSKNQKSTPFYNWIIISFGIGFILMPFGQILPILVSRVDDFKGWVGIIISVSSLCQFITMILYRNFRSITKNNLIIIGYLIYILGLVICVYENIIYIFSSQILFGIGFGFVIPALKEVIVDKSTKSNIRRNLLISDLVIFSISPLIASVLLGIVIPHFELNEIIYCFIVVLIITITAYIIFNLRRREEGNESTYYRNS